MSKIRVLLYTDCNLFGGSEHVIYNIIRNQWLRDKCIFSLLYRKSELYDQKVKELHYDEYCESISSLSLLTNYSIYGWLRDKIKVKLIRRLLFLPFYLLEKLGVYRLYNRLILEKFIKRNNSYDLIHINNGGYPGAISCLQIAIAAKKCSKMRILLQVNNLAEDGFEQYDSIINSVVSHIITASQNAKNALLIRRHIDEAIVTTLPNYVQDMSFHIESKINVEANHPVKVVQVALLQERKGQRYLIDAIKFLNSEHPGMYHLQLIGNGEDESFLRNKIELEHLSEGVELLGYRNDYIEYMKQADVIALPSIKDEDMPLVILTSMSMSKAIVSSTVGGIPEEVINGESAILLNPSEVQQPECLAAAIREAYKNKNVLGNNARLRYEAKFSAESYANSLLKIYNNI